MYRVVWSNSFGETVEQAGGCTRQTFRMAVEAAIERRRLQRSYRYEHQLQCPPAERAELIDTIDDLMARLIRSG